jgi:hypothetical protein
MSSTGQGVSAAVRFACEECFARHPSVGNGGKGLQARATYRHRADETSRDL